MAGLERAKQRHPAILWDDPPIAHQGRYLMRMSRPLAEKLRVARYIPKIARSVLDVGCADGTVTLRLAAMFPRKNFLGIDLNSDFISLANIRAQKQKRGNVRFERVYLRDLLARSKRYDAALFISVLHEFYTYGEGISSVLKALADAHELLKIGGEMVIRDMILHDYAKQTSFHVSAIISKIRSRTRWRRLVRNFERLFGTMNNLYRLNHFLLKYMYEDNWKRELQEHYIPVTFEQYEQLFQLLGMELQLEDSCLIDFLRRKWRRDFGLTDEEMEGLRSTGFLVARKTKPLR